jgi:hypothetical protein
MKNREKYEAERELQDQGDYKDRVPLHTPEDEQETLNPSARGTAEGPEDEENLYGNDPVGPNLGADLDDPDATGDSGVDNVRNAVQEKRYRSDRTGNTLYRTAPEDEDPFRKDEDQNE